MTREQIGAEKVALQKALLYYESIHGRPVSHPPPPQTHTVHTAHSVYPCISVTSCFLFAYGSDYKSRAKEGFCRVENQAFDCFLFNELHTVAEFE